MFEGYEFLLQMIGLFVVSAFMISAWTRVCDKHEQILKADYLGFVWMTFAILSVLLFFTNLSANNNLKFKLSEAQCQVVKANGERDVAIVANDKTVKEATDLVNKANKVAKEALAASDGWEKELLTEIALTKKVVASLRVSNEILHEWKVRDPDAYHSAVTKIVTTSVLETLTTSASAK